MAMGTAPNPLTFLEFNRLRRLAVRLPFLLVFLSSFEIYQFLTLHRKMRLSPETPLPVRIN